MSKTLQFRLLGNIQLRRNGTPVTDFSAGKKAALLSYLAVTGTAHTRSALAGLLWGAMPEAKARGNLSKALSTLRREFGDHLTITRQTVSFNRKSDYWLDVEIFAAGVANGSIDSLQEAIELYQGDFLDGFYVRTAPEFETWVLTQQTHLKELALQALHTLAGHFTAQGGTGRTVAINYITRLLEIDSWREEAHRQMMRLLATTGQRGTALAQYEKCRQILAEEVGVAPEAETTQLYEQIRSGNLDDDAEKQWRKRALGDSPMPDIVLPDFLKLDETPPPADSPPFVARDDELVQLEHLLQQTLDGKGRAAFVIGDPGSGKTALVEEFARKALTAETDLIAVGGNCNAYGGIGDPYLPFREILNLLTGDIEARRRTGALSSDLAIRLWRLVPQSLQTLVNVGPDLLDTFIPISALKKRTELVAADGAAWQTELEALLTREKSGPDDANVDQAGLFEMVTKLLQALAQQNALVLILDDLQWADAGSISLLFHLGRRLTGHRILIVGTYRPTDIFPGRDGRRHPLEPVINEFQQLFGDESVNLNQSKGRQFVESILEIETNRLSSAFKESLFELTQGHALFTNEILREMKERGDLIQDERGRWIEGTAIDWEKLPTRIEGVIAERIDRLPAPLQTTLKIASVEGEFFTAEIAARVQGIGEAETIRQLSSDLGRRHRLVGCQSSERTGSRRLSHYRFQHILFQKYLYNSLDEVERAYLHEMVGNELEQLYKGRTEEIAGRLAIHFHNAEIPQKTLDYWRQAGDAAARLHANTEAIGHYSRALRLSKQIDEDSNVIALLFTQLGRTLELDSQFEQAQIVYKDMERLAYQRGDEPMELASLIACMVIQAAPTAVHDPVRAQTLGQRALILVRKLADQPAESKILWILSLACYFDNKLEQAIEFGEHSLALARKLNLRKQTAQTLNDLGSFCYMYSGHLAQAKEALLEASMLWRETGNLPMLADSLASAAVAYVYTGEFKQALAHSEEAYQIASSIDNVWGQSYSRWKIGLGYWEQGDWGQAISVMEESIRLAKLAGFLIPQTNTQAELAALYGELGAVERGLDTVRLSLSIAQAQNPVQIGPGLGILARLQLLNGDVAAAKISIEAAKNEPYQETWPVFFIPVAIAEAELMLKLRKYKQALVVTEALLIKLRQFGMRAHIVYALYLEGQALLGAGRDAVAQGRFVEACTEAEAINSRRNLWRILYALSQLEANPTRSEDLRQQAQRVIEFIVAHIDDEQANLRQSFLDLPDVQAVYKPVESI